MVNGTPPAFGHPASESPATHLHVSVAVTAPDPSLQPGEPATSTLHRVLGQTAFLMHEQGNNQAAALLADVGNVEPGPASRLGHPHDAILIVPAYLVPRLTEDVIAAIRPVFEHVAGRHGLRINAVTAAPALPQIGDDWRQVLQTKLATEAVPDQLSQPRAEEAAVTPRRQEPTADGTCTRNAKTTGRRCRRRAAEWPIADDLPAPVAACFGHLTLEEKAACQQARARSTKEFNARWKAEHAARESSGDVPRPAASPSATVRPCTGPCTSQEHALGHDSDEASVTCAKCGGWVCVSCGQAKVDGAFEACPDCSKQESFYDAASEDDGQHDEEADTEPAPHTQLTAMVNDLVKATGTTHRQVNARLNRGWWYPCDAAHVAYWNNHSLPVTLLLFDPRTERVHWQHVTPDTLVTTGKNYKVFVPVGQQIDQANGEV